MLDWLKQRVGRWFAESVPATSAPAAPATKAATSATLTNFLGSSGSGSSQWSDTNTARYNTAWVFAAVRLIAERIAGQPVRAGRLTRTKPDKAAPRAKAAAASPPWLRPGDVKELSSHPFLEAWHDPNAYLTSWGLLYLTVASLKLTGVAYLWIDDQPDGSTRIWFLPAGWVREDVEHNGPRLSRFTITPAASGQQFKLTDAELIRFSLPDPSDPLAGLGPLKAGFAAVETDKEIQTAQLMAFKNGIMPRVMVTIGQEAANSALGDPDERPILTREQRKALTNLIREAYSGTENSGDPIILDGLIKGVERLSQTVQEMDFSESSGLTKERILQVFGVNPIILGQVAGANRATATVADEHFCYSTCGPVCVLIGQTLTKWLRVKYQDADLCVWVEPPKPRDPDARRADLQQLVGASAITVDELRAEHGLPPLPDGAGKALVIGYGRQPVTHGQPSDPPDRDDRKDTESPLARLNEALNNGRLKRIVVDEHTPPPSEN